MIKKSVIRRVETDDNGQFVKESWVARNVFKEGDYIALIYNDIIIKYDDLLELHKELSTSKRVMDGFDESVKEECNLTVDELDLLLERIWFVFAGASDGILITDQRYIETIKWIADRIGIKIDKDAYMYGIDFGVI